MHLIVYVNLFLAALVISDEEKQDLVCESQHCFWLLCHFQDLSGFFLSVCAAQIFQFHVFDEHILLCLLSDMFWVMASAPMEVYFRGNKKRQYVRSDLIVKAFMRHRLEAKFIDINMWVLALQWSSYLHAFVSFYRCAFKKSTNPQGAKCCTQLLQMRDDTEVNRFWMGIAQVVAPCEITQQAQSYCLRFVLGPQRRNCSCTHANKSPIVTGDVIAKHDRIVGGNWSVHFAPPRHSLQHQLSVKAPAASWSHSEETQHVQRGINLSTVLLSINRRLSWVCFVFSKGLTIHRVHVPVTLQCTHWVKLGVAVIKSCWMWPWWQVNPAGRDSLV